MEILEIKSLQQQLQEKDAKIESMKSKFFVLYFFIIDLFSSMESKNTFFFLPLISIVINFYIF